MVEVLKRNFYKVSCVHIMLNVCKSDNTVKSIPVEDSPDCSPSRNVSIASLTPAVNGCGLTDT
jgi:hypothetical protein